MQPEPCGDSEPLPEPVASDLDLLGQLFARKVLKPMQLVKIVGDLL
jgi:hypothetical protein